MAPIWPKVELMSLPAFLLLISPSPESGGIVVILPSVLSRCQRSVSIGTVASRPKRCLRHPTEDFDTDTVPHPFARVLMKGGSQQHEFSVTQIVAFPSVVSRCGRLARTWICHEWGVN